MCLVCNNLVCYITTLLLGFDAARSLTLDSTPPPGPSASGVGFGPPYPHMYGMIGRPASQNGDYDENVTQMSQSAFKNIGKFDGRFGHPHLTESIVF